MGHLTLVNLRERLVYSQAAAALKTGFTNVHVHYISDAYTNSDNPTTPY